MKAKAYAAHNATSPLVPYVLERRKLGPKDILIEILYSGICHSDIHQARSEWGPANYPMVPGHEIVGRVVEVGKKVRRFKVGHYAGVGCFVDSCRKCHTCKDGDEQFCEKGAAFTYNSTEMDRVTPTQGGYSTHIVVDELYALKVATNKNLERIAPLLCAGVTTYAPLKRFGVKKGHKVAVVGLGGLGHMAVKIAKAMGAHVTVFSTSASKEADAKKLGAKQFINTRLEGAFEKHAGEFDFILDTASAQHDINAYLGTLKRNGKMTLVGVPAEPCPVAAFSLIMGQKSLAGSLIGNLKETQEVLNFCIKKKVFADVEVIPATKINEAFERTIKSDVKYRFVIDAKTF